MTGERTGRAPLAGRIRLSTSTRGRNHVSVFEAALDRLASRNYRQITMESLAERTGVSRTTIYRRWPTKAGVVAAAVSSLYLDQDEVPDTGSLSQDLVALLTDTYRVMADGDGRVLEQLVRQSGQNPELVDVVCSILYARRRVSATALNHAIARGELTPDIDQELLLGPSPRATVVPPPRQRCAHHTRRGTVGRRARPRRCPAPAPQPLRRAHPPAVAMTGLAAPTHPLPGAVPTPYGGCAASPGQPWYGPGETRAKERR
jgi:AcrR family transcriptional regulator